MAQVRRSSAFLSAQKGDVDRLRREAEAVFQLFLKRLDDLDDGLEELEEDLEAVAPLNASFVTTTVSGALTDERVLTAGTNITITDNGAGSTVVVDCDVDDEFIEDVVAGVCVAGTNMTITYNDVAGTLTFDTVGITQEQAEDAIAAMCVEGNGIDIVYVDGTPTLTFSVDESELAMQAPQYVVLANTAALPNERALTEGNGIDLVDGGAGSTITIAVDESELALQAPSYVCMANTASLPNERRLREGHGIDITDGGAGGDVNILVDETEIDVARSLGAITANVDVVNTITETAIVDITIPANTVPADGRIRLDVGGDHLNSTGSNRFWTIRILLNGVEIYQDDTQTYASNAQRRQWRLCLMITRKSATTGYMHGEYNSHTVAGAADTGLGVSDSNTATGTPIGSGTTDIAGLDWTAAQDLEVLITPSGTGANCSFAIRGGGLEVIR